MVTFPVVPLLKMTMTRTHKHSDIYTTLIFRAFKAKCVILPLTKLSEIIILFRKLECIFLCSLSKFSHSMAAISLSLKISTQLMLHTAGFWKNLFYWVLCNIPPLTPNSSHLLTSWELQVIHNYSSLLPNTPGGDLHSTEFTLLVLFLLCCLHVALQTLWLNTIQLQW